MLESLGRVLDVAAPQDAALPSTSLQRDGCLDNDGRHDAVVAHAARPDLWAGVERRPEGAVVESLGGDDGHGRLDRNETDGKQRFTHAGRREGQERRTPPVGGPGLVSTAILILLAPFRTAHPSMVMVAMPPSSS